MALRGLSRAPLASAGLVLGGWLLAPPAEAAVVRGIQAILAGILQLPVSMLAGTFSGPPVVGTVLGAARGAVSGVGMVASGALELIASGVSLAKTAAPFLLPFLL